MCIRDSFCGMLWPENKTLVQLGGYGEAGANPARFRHRDAPARQSGLCAVLPPGAQSGYRAQLAYNAHGAMGCVQKSAAWHRAPPRAVRHRFVPPFRFQPGRQGNICPPFRSVQTKPPTAAVRPATGAFLFPVSYTHLDVYKRQVRVCARSAAGVRHTGRVGQGAVGRGRRRGGRAGAYGCGPPGEKAGVRALKAVFAQKD